MKKKVHIISHTHWDREWYINSRYVNEWLPVFFDGLFKMMEKEPEYRFMLDGQTSMLDDCYAELKKLGRSVREFQEKVAHYAARGQLILGPYYLQPDWQLVSGESLVRNMMIGRRMVAELGGGVSTGWLLDNFGQISQAPQLNRQFGMKGIVVWRGVELDPFHLTSEFEWVGADGTRMVSSYLLSSYRNAMHLADYPAILYDRIRNEAEKIAPFSTTGQVLLMNGYDQEMQPDDILPYIKNGQADFDDYEVCQSTPDEFMDALLAHRGELPQLHGALYSGRYISVFPGILSSRMYPKLMNDETQRELEQYAEPLSVLCAAMGWPYPHDQLEKAWKKLLKNHPHDSICGVGVDDVHQDMVGQFRESLSLARECTARAASRLSAAADTAALKGAEAIFCVCDPLPFSRQTGVFLPCADPQTVCVKDVYGRLCPAQPTDGGVAALVTVGPAGVLPVGIFPGEEPGSDPQSAVLSAENEYLQVTCLLDGTFTVTDKTSGRVYTGLGALEDSADSGDEYNYSFLTGDKPLTTCGVPAQVSVTERGPVRTVFRVRRVWELPESLNGGRDARSAALRELPVETTVTLTRGDPVLRFCTTLRNTCRDHRVRVLFPTDMQTDESFAQTQFDMTRHPICPAEFDNAGIPETVKRIIIGARESLPITQFPQKDFCALTDGAVTAAVVNRGLPEYEVLLPRKTVALTLFRSVGWLTRFDLNTRIGDAGPEMFTPEAQCLRDMEFTYGFCSLPAAPDSRLLDRAVQAFNTPPVVVSAAAHPGAAPSAFLELRSEEAVHLTAMKCADQSRDVIVRLYNAASRQARQTLLCMRRAPAIRLRPRRRGRQAAATAYRAGTGCDPAHAAPREQDFGGHLARCDSFTADVIRGEGEGVCGRESFVSFLVTDGEGTLSCGGEAMPVRKGDSLFLPAGSGAWKLSGGATVLVSWVTAPGEANT